jgi:hypothetical protein
MNRMNLIPLKVIYFFLFKFSFSLYFSSLPIIPLNLVDGPLYYRGCEEDAVPFIEKRKIFEKNDTEEYCYYYNGITPDDSPYKKKKQPIEDRAPAGSSKQGKDHKQKQQRLHQHRGDEEKIDEETKEEPGHHEHRRPLQLQHPDRSTHVVSAAPAPPTKRSLTLDKDSLLLFMQMSSKSWKEFFSFCYRENPFLSFISLILLVVIYAFHPDLTKLVVPVFVGCYFLVAFMNE